VVAAFLVLAYTRADPIIAKTVDLGLWDKVMKDHVKKGAQLGLPIHIVDYGGIAADPNYATFMKQLETADTSGLTRNESFALGANVYNAFAIAVMIKYPCRYEDQFNNDGKCYGPNVGLPQITFAEGTEALCDGGKAGVFGTPTKSCVGTQIVMHKFAGKPYSCDQFESLIHPVPLGPLFDTTVASYSTEEDFRVHATLVCDGTSCPNQKIGAYTPDTIDEQFDAATTEWMASPWKGVRVDKTTNTVTFSQIFKWFAREFDKQPGGMVKIYDKFWPADVKAYFDSGVKYDTEYFNYLWSPNGPIQCDCDDVHVLDTSDDSNAAVPVFLEQYNGPGIPNASASATPPDVPAEKPASKSGMSPAVVGIISALVGVVVGAGLMAFASKQGARNNGSGLNMALLEKEDRSNL
jgi:hypothetical protein